MQLRTRIWIPGMSVASLKICQPTSSIVVVIFAALKPQLYIVFTYKLIKHYLVLYPSRLSKTGLILPVFSYKNTSSIKPLCTVNGNFVCSLRRIDTFVLEVSQSQSVCTGNNLVLSTGLIM